ncbi:hypothetical protein C0993_006772 [Termitomyces sp. T159_Od127]|nr:hypothetical protein C0993_006772 [Termitomyces sp. T159_Od127]
MRMIYKNLDDRRQAAKLGARLARRIDGKSIGNIDVLAALQRFRDTGYLGKKFQRQMFSVLGSGVFNTDGDMWKWVFCNLLAD